MDSINKKLYENYEEAGFAILMDEYAQLEGDRLLAEFNNSLNDPTFSPPEGMVDRGIKRIRREFRKRALHTAFSHVYKPLARIAMVVLALNVFFSIAFFSIEAFRVEVLNMALQFQETHTSVRFVDSSVTGQLHYTSVEIQEALPASFLLISSEEYGNESYYEFSDNNGHFIKWREFPTSTEFNLDTEDADTIDTIIIGGSKGVLTEKNEKVSVVWYDAVAGSTYYLTGNIDRSDVLHIIEKISN